MATFLDLCYNQAMDIQNEKTYDSVFWTAVVKMTRFLIPLVNEAFGEHYTDKAEVDLIPGKQSIEHIDSSYDEREMDSFARLTESGISKNYHFEVQVKTDKSFAIRIAEYAAGAAQESVALTENGARIVIPYSAVIFLRATTEVPDKLHMEIEYPGGKVFYDAPVMKIKNYSVKDLIDKRLLLLLPFYGFNFDKRFAAMETEGIEQLKAALEELNTSLSSLVESGDINEAQRGHLLDWTQRVLDKLTVRYKNVKKGVDDLMGGYIINTRTDAILKEGREQEQRERIEEMLRDGHTPEEIVNFCKYPMSLVLDVEKNLLSLA